MSYEGYTQVLCENGHASHEDVYAVEISCYDEDWKCKTCGAKAVWRNEVDLTNGSFYKGERIDGFVHLEEKTSAEYKICNMGHKHLIKETTYKIPENKK
jgi:hypothetical protein